MSAPVYCQQAQGPVVLVAALQTTSPDPGHVACTHWLWSPLWAPHAAIAAKGIWSFKSGLTVSVNIRVP